MPQYNNSIESAAKILDLFTPSHPWWGLSETARKLQLAKSTTHNLLSTLKKIGFLEKNEETQKYGLGKRMLSLGAITAVNMDLSQKSAGFIQELASTYGSSCRLGIWDLDAVNIIYSANSVSIHQYPSFQAGPRIPGYCTSLGRAILAYMDTEEVKSYLDRIKIIKFSPKTKTSKSKILKALDITKSRGFATIDEELINGNAAIGAPIFDKKNNIAGAISLNGSASDIFGSKKDELVNALMHKAFQISHSLGYGS